MENLYIKSTHQTPEINFQLNGNLFIKGISTPVFAKKHYKPIFDWLEEYKNHLPSEINFNLELDYLNTSSSIIFIDLFILVNSYLEVGCKVNLTWHYEAGDEDMMDLGMHLSKIAKSKLNFVEI